MENNLARGIRKASDFLMGLQLTGAYKHASIANLQVSLPAIVIGGVASTAIDTATELLAYYQIQVEKELERFELLLASGHPEAELRKRFDDEEREALDRHLGHGRELRAEKARAAAEGREPDVQKLLDSWGGVTLVYRKGLESSPAYRLNHEEVIKSLEEGVRYVEHMSPVEAVLDERAHVKGVRFRRDSGEIIELPGLTVCVAAGTSPNVIYEKEYPGTFELDDKKQYFRPYAAKVDASGQVTLSRATGARYRQGERRLLHELPEGRTHRLVLRRQPSTLRRQRRPGDGECEGRLPSRRVALSGDRRRYSAGSRPERSSRCCARSSRSSTRSSWRPSTR